ncbi:MAG: hypothetical protein IPJ18_02370 [Betaproteobacteria bacterium]|nr:hypothetical protein [Betaproteobacteria bacterium]
MPLLHRLSLAQKFMILGVIAMLMVLVPTGLYFKTVVSDIRAAQVSRVRAHR